MTKRKTDAEQAAESMNPLRLFVYGTLKCGYWNHDRFCQGALCIEQARVRGRLYSLPSGIPVLKVPNNNVLATGTSDPMADVATQERLSRELLPAEAPCDSEDWRMIHGELVVFPNPRLSLPPIDMLEGFRPGTSSMYRRVLVPVITNGDERVAAWLYVCGESIRQGMAPTNKTSWP